MLNMVKRSRITLAASVLLATIVAPFLLWNEKAHGDLPSGATPSFEQVVVVTTAHDALATESTVRRMSPGSDGISLGVISHPAGAVLRGDATPDGLTAYVVADQEPSDFGAHLFKANGKVNDLGGNVLHAARPLLSESGVIYVERGKEGRRDPAAMRVDHLTIDELKPAEAAPRFRTLFAADGFALHIAGEWQKQLVVYLVDGTGATILLLPEDGSPARDLARVPAFARDFSISGNRLAFSNRAPADSHLWEVVELSLENGASKVLRSQRDEALAPFALTGRTIAGTDLHDRAPAGPGFYQVADVTRDEKQWVVSFVPRGADTFDETWMIDEGRSVSARLGSADKRIETLRVVSSRSGGVR